MIFFPDRLPLDRRHPWLKWVLITPIIFIAVLFPSRKFGIPVARDIVATLGRAATVISLGFVACLFALLAIRYRTALDPDDRRRLRLLYWGTVLALAPQMVLQLIRNMMQRSDYNWVPAPLLIVTEVLTLAFPLTLAYVIVVQRALDVRVVVRQGLQYALARNGVVVMQALAIAAIILASVRLAEEPDVNRAERIALIAAGLAFIFAIGRGAARLRQSIDRRFFRESWRAEQILSALADDVRTIVSVGPLLETVARRISESLHVPRLAILLREGTCFQPAYALGYAAESAPVIPEEAPVVAALEDARRPLQMDPELLLPLASRDKLLGILSLGPKQSEEPYSPSDLQLLQSVAAQTGLALENSLLAAVIAEEAAQRERLNREIEIARDVQQRFFPQSYPPVPGIEYAGHCRPALSVGGDYYDFLDLPGSLFGFAIGDVSGKGIPAALLMASLQASLRSQTMERAGDLGRVMANINRLIYDTTPVNRYATFFYGEYDTKDRKLTYVNAGHNPPLLLRGEETMRLEDGGPVVGLFPQAVYIEGSVTLAPGDLLVAFTDGISEAMNAADEEWGEERLADAVRTCAAGLPPSKMIARLLECADQFAAGAPQHDDMTLLVVRVGAATPVV
jgi:sigma-B regulation protein RsbU (phosphoserine phosphatase)